MSVVEAQVTAAKRWKLTMQFYHCSKVVHADTPLAWSVTKQDLLSGTARACFDCPAAQGIKREHGAVAAMVQNRTVKAIFPYGKNPDGTTAYIAKVWRSGRGLARMVSIVDGEGPFQPGKY
jgi:hypothetical protein